MRRHYTCESCRGLLHNYADGRLRERERQAVEMHMVTCARCRESVAEIVKLRRLLTEREVPAPSADFWERCARTVAAGARVRRLPVWRTWKTAFGIAAAGALVALAIWFSPLRPAQTPTAVSEMTAQAEVPDFVYFMHHAGFAAAKSLGFTSQYVLVSSRAGEGETPDLTGDTD